MKYLFLSTFLIAAAAVMAQSQENGATPPQPAAEFHHHEPGEPGLLDETPERIAQLKKEAETLEAGIKASPKDAELNIKLGFTYSRLRMADDAQRAFENAVRLNPKKAIAHYMLGLIYEKKGMKDRAVAAWKACLDNADEPRLRDTAVKHLNHLTGAR